jgi:O-acetyl-ADP-ribose deacetylase (regulator of RNase III)
MGATRLVLLQGNITEQDTEAIVNAANSSLMGGGGVDGAIHRAGGPQILEECKKIVGEIGRLPAGEAVVTSGGRLRAKYVIHTVGPVWGGGSTGEADILARAYQSSLSLAIAKGVKRISFPSISTGAYGFPIELASEIALRAVIDFVKKTALDEVRFVLFSKADWQVYNEALSRMR